MYFGGVKVLTAAKQKKKNLRLPNSLGTDFAAHVNPVTCPHPAESRKWLHDHCCLMKFLLVSSYSGKRRYHL